MQSDFRDACSLLSIVASKPVLFHSLSKALAPLNSYLLSIPPATAGLLHHLSISFNSQKFWLFGHCFLYSLLSIHYYTHTHTHTHPQVNLGSMILRYNHSLANTPDSFTLLFLCQYFQGEKKKATTPIKPNCPSLLEELAYISWIVLF